MTNILHILTFIEVINRNSFAAAARHLKLTPAAVSKHISSLEQSLHTQLLKRSTHQLQPTPEGEIYYHHAKKIIESISDAKAAISDMKSEPAGKLKVVCGPEFGNLYVLPHLKEFLKTHPKLHLEIVFTLQIPDIENEKIDLLLGFSRNIPQNCIIRPLIEARDVICASPDYLKIHGTPKKPKDLLNHAIITHTRWPNDVLSFKNREEVTFTPILRLNDTRAITTSALNGIGIVQLHDYIVRKALKTGELVEILVDYCQPKKKISIYAAYPQTPYVHINTNTFIKFIQEKIL